MELGESSFVARLSNHYMVNLYCLYLWIINTYVVFAVHFVLRSIHDEAQQIL